VYVVAVLDVIPEDGDTCDPLVQINFNNQTKATSHKEKTLTAEFKEKLIFDGNFESLEVEWWSDLVCPSGSSGGQRLG
jgi:hypothetical protein